MSLITVSPFTSKVSRAVLGIYNVTDKTTIDGQQGAFVTQLVVGYGVTDHNDLRDAIREAVARLGKEYRIHTSQEEKEKKIKELREKDEARTAVSYSRECTICSSPNPETRAVLTACGHALCMACVLTLSKKGRLLCPFCRKSTAYVKLHEDIAEEKKETENEKKEEEVSEKISELFITPSLATDSPPSSSPPPSAPCVHRLCSSCHPPNDPLTPRSDRVVSSISHNTNVFLSSHIISVSNLPLHTTERDLIQLFDRVGQVINVTFFSKHHSYAFCDFNDAQTAKNVCAAFHQIKYKNRKLRLSMAD